MFCVNREEDKTPLQKRIYDRRMREQARKRHAQSLLERTVKDSKQIGQARSEGTGAFEMLTHASQTADLDAPANKSLFLFKINSPLRLQAARIQASLW